MSLKRTVLFDVSRILSFDVNRILSFDVNRILSFDLDRILRWDIGRALRWRVPPMLLKGLAGWILAAIVLNMLGMWRGGLAVLLAAASAWAFMLPGRVRRLRTHRAAAVESARPVRPGEGETKTSDH